MTVPLERVCETPLGRLKICEPETTTSVRQDGRVTLSIGDCSLAKSEVQSVELSSSEPLSEDEPRCCWQMNSRSSAVFSLACVEHSGQDR